LYNTSIYVVAEGDKVFRFKSGSQKHQWASEFDYSYFR